MILTQAQLESFRQVAQAIVTCDEENERANDLDDQTALLNQIWHSLPTEVIDRFVGIVSMSSESDFRSPK